MITAGVARGVFAKMHGTASQFTQGMDPGFLRSVGTGITNFAGSNASTAGTVYGAGIGAVGGVLSSDKDMNWYSGAAQGAFAGAQIATRGLSGLGVAGAIGGGLYGMMADDTSIMTGAFVGAGLGRGRTHLQTGLKHAKQGDLGKKFKLAANYSKTNTPAQNYNVPFSAPRGRALRMPVSSKGKKAGAFRRAGWGANAVFNAVKNDVGFGWRAGWGTKRARVQTNSMGKAKPKFKGTNRTGKTGKPIVTYVR